jgi:chloride channel 7
MFRPAERGEVGVREDVESLDYDIDSSSIFEQDLQHQSAQFRRCQNAQRWAVCAAIGCTTGFVAFLIDVFTAQILQKKYAIAAAAMQYIPVGNDSGPFFAVMAAYVALSILCVAVAAVLVVFVEPVAGGSGIPEVKTYLQGVKVPRLLRTTTLLCKAVGVVFSVSSGLVVGKEGPMIHAGSIVAAGLSQGSSKSCGWRTTCLRRFRNDHDKRDFVSAGAAAGVAAAFGAPIGGVLFAMEEAASFWSQQLTWRTFFCALCSTFTLNLLLSCDPRFQPDKRLSAPFGQLSHPGLITFGKFPQPDPYSLPEMPVFLLIGVAGGLMGALFNRLNVRLTMWRSKHMVTQSTWPTSK